ncbi:MAG: ATP-binding protein [Bacteroidota bacterium]
MKTLQDLEASLLSKTILELMEELVHFQADNLVLCKKELDTITRPYLKALGKRLRLSRLEILAFSLIFKRYAWGGMVQKSEISECWDKSLVGAGTFHNTIEKLEQKGLVIPRSHPSGRIGYIIPHDVSKDIYQNRTPSAHTSPINAYELADRIMDLVRKLDDEEIDSGDAYLILQIFLTRASSLPFSKKLIEWDLSAEEGLLVAMLYAQTMLQDGLIDSERASLTLLCEKGLAAAFHYRIQQKKGKLFEKNIVQHAAEEFETGSQIEFTEQTYNILFENIEFEKRKYASSRSVNMPVIKADTIIKKQLHYNPTEGHSVNQLEQCMQPEAFQRICKELRDEGMTPGFTILLYGGPGTGKTETALQLARATGRDIIKVDIATLRDKYVGESEKQVKRIFDTYREELRLCKVAPILLLNEADGIISNRTKEVHQSTDQMHNSMQNIFLEELEIFEGILIATTNYESKLDRAFERRFLHKIKMEAPSIDVRSKIISEKIKIVSKEDATRLASMYSLSGGQLDNIARKILTTRLMNGSEPSLTEIEVFFETETFVRKKPKQLIGFRSSNEAKQTE